MIKTLLRTQRTFKNAFMKKFLLFFRNLTPKNDWIFIETKIKSLMLHKKNISINYNQNTNKTDENRKKTIVPNKFYCYKKPNWKQKNWAT